MLWFYLYLVLAVAVLTGGYWLWRRRVDVQLRDASDFEWDIFIKNDPEFVSHLNAESFYKIFHRTHFPHYPTYWLAAFATFLLTLPVTFTGLFALEWSLGKLGVIPASVDVANRFFIEGDRMRIFTAAPSESALILAENMGGFFYFFGVLFAWLGIVALFLRHYHKNRPGYLRDEIIRSRT